MTPLYRSPEELARLERFFVPDEMKNHILAEFATGFVSHFEYEIPEAWGSVTNYAPLTSAMGRQKFRAAMREQVLQGRMIGGIG